MLLSARLVLASAALVVACPQRRLPECLGPLPVVDQDNVTLSAAGDIASCEALKTASATADLLGQRDGLVLSLGDNAYPNGSISDFLDCYDPTWGRVRERIAPVLGNHEFHSIAAAPYFAYFCGRTGEPGRGYYSFDYGRWHVVVLNSVCGDDVEVPAEVITALGGCDAGSAQAQWLEADLAAHPSRCTLAAYHHPRFTSGGHRDAVHMSDLFSILYRHGVDLVLNGHVHSYERFDPMAPDGTVDPVNGIREIVVGTGGGESHATFPSVHVGSVVRDTTAHGVLELALGPTGYSWKFLPVAGDSFTNQGEAECH